MAKTAVAGVGPAAEMFDITLSTQSRPVAPGVLSRRDTDAAKAASGRWMRSPTPSLDQRQHFELVERRRRGQRPFERGRARPPRIVGRAFLAPERNHHAVEEDHDADGRNVGAERGDHVPTVERIRIVNIAARHAGQAEEVLWEEHQVHTHERHPEVQLADPLVVHVAGDLREPVVPAGKDRKHGAERQHVVEMRHHVVGFLQDTVDRRIRQHDAGDAADREQKDEPDRPQHRSFELDGAAPHGGDPGEDLYPRRHRDHHRGGDEIGLRAARHTDRIHVVRPHHEADHPDRHHRIGHAEIAEHRLAAEGGDDLAHNAEARQDQDVDFRMSEEPEQVLEQDRIAAVVGIEEGGAEITVGEQHRDGARQHRQGKQQQEHRHQDRPHEQRHLVQRHAGRAHVEDRGDEVDGAEDRGGAGEMQREDREIDRRSRMAHQRRQRRIDGPAGPDAVRTRCAFNEGRCQQQGEGGRQQPERNVVHARKRHVGRSDHQRHDPVAEPTDHRRHHHEEDHDQAMRRGEHIVRLGVVENLQARVLQLQPDRDRHRPADDAGHHGEHQVHRTDVLVIGRIDEASPAGRMTVVAVGDCVRGRVVIHRIFLRCLR